MIRYSIFLLMIVGVTAFGFSKLATAQASLTSLGNVTVIYQTAFSDGNHPVVLERCANEDCSDTNQ